MRMNILDALKSSQSCFLTAHSRTSHRTHIPTHTHQYFIHNLLNPSRRPMEWMNILLRALESTDVRYRYFPEDGEERRRWVSESYKNKYKKMTKWVCLFGWFGCLFHMSDGSNGRKQSGSNVAARNEMYLQCDWHLRVVAVGLDGFFYIFNNKMLNDEKWN